MTDSATEVLGGAPAPAVPDAPRIGDVGFKEAHAAAQADGGVVPLIRPSSEVITAARRVDRERGLNQDSYRRVNWDDRFARIEAKLDELLELTTAPKKK
jgi:hypothetical protein